VRVGYQLGVDLGTTYTAAAVLRGARAEVATLGTRSLEVPSVAYLRDDGEMLIGEAAERRSLTEPDRFVREFKRRIGDTTPILLGGSPFSAHTLMARLLRTVVKVVADREGGFPEHVVVTCPANWGDYKRELFDQAIHQADVGPTSVITEPEAAAVHYATTTRVGPGETVAVYDLGGGTFDAAVLRNTGTRFDLLGEPQGVEQLGGVYFDDAVFNYVAGYVADALAQLDPDDPGTVAGVSRLRRDCVEAKEALSWDTDVTIPVAFPNQRTEVRLTRSEFEDMIRPALAESLEAMRRALRLAPVEPPQLKAVLLVGGSSRIPLVAQMLGYDLQRPTAIDIHPKHAVALGAAHLAGVEAVEKTAVVPQVPRPVPTPAPPRVPEPVPAPAPLVPAPVEIPDVVDLRTPRPIPPERRPLGRSSGDGEGPRRGVFLVAAATVVLLAGLAWLLLGGGGGGGGDDDGGGSDSTLAASDASTQTAEPVDIPRGEPLDTNTLAFTQKDGDAWNVWLTQADGSNARALTREQGVFPRLPAWSPDRTSLAYTVQNGTAFELYVVDTVGDAPRKFADQLGPDARGTWSPDGEQLAFVRQIDGVLDLWILDLRTSDLRQLTDTPAEESDPAWSPDGSSIAVWMREGGNEDIYLLPVAGGEPQRLTEDSGQDADPAWSPDGSQLAFATNRDGNWEIYVMNADGTDQRALTVNDADDQDPAWSPDGTQIAFGSKRDGDPDDPNADESEIYVMAADGSGQTNISNRPGFDAHPAWGVTPPAG
jgi:Tol biopolymer transport system component